jgi:hypothetical protein
MILIRYQIRTRSNEIGMERKHVPTLPLYYVFLSCAKSKGKVKVKCTFVQALRLGTVRMAHRGSRGIALLYRH